MIWFAGIACPSRDRTGILRTEYVCHCYLSWINNIRLLVLLSVEISERLCEVAAGFCRESVHCNAGVAVLFPVEMLLVGEIDLQFIVIVSFLQDGIVVVCKDSVIAAGTVI